MTNRTCRFCGETKDMELFVQNLSYACGRATVCKMCSKQQAADRRKDNPYIYKAWKYKKTPEEIKAILESRKDCAICGGTRRLVIDHNHKTGQLRELLCDGCNKGIGSMKEDPEILIKAAEYLRKHNE